MLPPSSSFQRIVFDRFEADLLSGELRKNGRRIRLQAKPFQLLALLLERPGEVVTREEVCGKLWKADTFVDFDHSLGTAINKIREALGDSADAPRFVETLPRRGYRFIFPVSPQNGTESSVASAATLTGLEHTRRARRFRWTIAAVTAIVVLGASVSVWWSFSRKAHALTEKDTIVLADFTNTTGDPVFDGTLRQGLAVQFEQSPFLSLVSDQQIQQTLQMMGQNPDTKLTPALTREVCERTSSAGVLDGSIAQIGTRYLLTLKAINCSSGEVLASAEAQASNKSQVLDALGKAASEIRSKLGESLTTVQKFDTPLEQATTSSLEALKAFTLAARSGGVTPYTSLLQHAIELDPHFALAYVLLSDYYDGVGEAELASEYAQKAFDNRVRATEAERFHITATYYYAVLGDLDQELATEHATEQMYPRYWATWNDSADGWLSLGDYTRALKEGQEALRLNPRQSESYLTPGRALLALDRRNEVKQIALRAQAHSMDVPAIHILVYQVAFLEGDTKEMNAQLTPMLAKPGKEAFGALWAQSSTEAYSGHRRNSLEISRKALELVRNHAELTAQVLAAEGLREAEFGNSAKAMQAVPALSLSSGRTAKLLSALALARAGDVNQARALADELNRQFPSHTLMQRYWLPTIRGSIELARKNPSKALEALQGVSYEFGDTGLLAGNLYPVYVRGQAYLGTRQGNEAAAEFQKLLDHPSIVLNSPLGVLAHLGLARAFVLQGDTPKARAAYQDFLALWKGADPDIPILKQAVAEYAKLN